MGVSSGFTIIVNRWSILESSRPYKLDFLDGEPFNPDFTVGGG